MEVFEAIGDPVRREILLGLVRGDLSAGEIAGRFAISRPAVSRHLRVLREAGLVRDAASGRRRIYRLTPDGLAPVHAWLAELTSRPSADGVWSPRLAALDTEVRRARRERLRHAATDSSAETETRAQTTKETA